jgi:ubiquinone/menaquinone biosynthesis C-methylase UbiE
MAKAGVRPQGDTLGEIAAALSPLQGRRILDIGCGPGHLLRALAAGGAEVAGVDPDAAALEEARLAAPSADIRSAPAEALPFGGGAFQAAIFLNSLHHVPEPAMAAALAEAARVVGKGGDIIVVEPLAEGSFFAALMPVEDETAVRHAAQRAVARALGEGRLRLARQHEYDRVESYPDLDAFLARIILADPARRERVGAARAEVSRRLEALGERGLQGYVLRQPHRLQHLTVPDQADRHCEP